MADIEKLAQEHWDWVEGLLESQCRDGEWGLIDYSVRPKISNPSIKPIVEYLYKTAFIHGYKHGVEDNAIHPHVHT